MRFGMALRFLRSYRFWAIASTLSVALIYLSCGDDEVNVFQPIAEPFALKSDEKAKLEQARVLIDNARYGEALKLIEPMIGDAKEDSNDARLLYAAAKLGESGLDVWSIISTLIDGASSGSSGGGIDRVFDQFSTSLLGSGEARVAKTTALSNVLETLLGAPKPDEKRVSNTACLLAGLLAVPAVSDATESMESALSALSSIRDSAQSDGQVCPNISLLDAAMAGIGTVSADFNLILQAASNCSFIDVDEAQQLMNTVEQALSKLRSGADKGCASLPSCPATVPDCTQLFPTCVQEALAVGTSNVAADDGLISSCELVLHCTDPTVCFN